MFDAAQKQLQLNRERSPRNCKHDYLLRGHVRCCQCGQVYTGEMTNSRTYRCAGRKKAHVPVVRCSNKGWRADKLEDIVWGELEAYLGDRDLIIAELEKSKQAADQTGALETEFKQLERQLKAIDREQHQLLQWALKDFPGDQVEAENRRLNKAKEILKSQKTELEARVKASMDAAVDVPMLERFIEDMQNKLPDLDLECKRLALDMLGITVYLDAENVEITGTIDSGIVLTPLSAGYSLFPFPKGGSAQRESRPVGTLIFFPVSK